MADAWAQFQDAPAADPWASFQDASSAKPAADPAPPARQMSAQEAAIRKASPSLTDAGVRYQMMPWYQQAGENAANLVNNVSEAVTVPITQGVAAVGGTLGSVGTSVGNLLGLTNRNPESVRQSITGMALQPRTDMGRGASDLMALPGTAYDLASRGVRQVLPPAADAMDFAKQPMFDALTMVGVGEGVRSGAGAIQAARERSAFNAKNRVASNPLEVGQEAGFQFNPSAIENSTAARAPQDAMGKVGSAAARAAEDFGGSNYTKHNKERTNSIAAQDIGLAPDAILTDAAIAEAKKPAAAVFDRAKTELPATEFSPSTRAAIAKAGNDGLTSGQRLPNEINRAKYQLINRRSAPMNTAELMQEIANLRQQGFQDLTPAMPGGRPSVKQTLTGNARLDMANALDAELQARAEAHSPQFAADIKNARRLFAKIGTVERARVGYDINPTALKRAAAKSNAIDGGLKIIADMAEHFPGEFSLSVPKRDNSAIHTAIDIASVGTVPLARAGARGVVNMTRGQNKQAVLDKSGPLRGYFSREAKPVIQEPITRTDRLLPKPGEVSIDLPNFDAKYGAFGDSRTAPPNILRLPAPGNVTGGSHYSPMRPTTNSIPDGSVAGPFEQRAMLGHPAGSDLTGPRVVNQLTMSDPTWAPPNQLPVPPENIPVANVLAQGIRLQKQSPTPVGPKVRGNALAGALEGRSPMPRHADTAQARRIYDPRSPVRNNDSGSGPASLEASRRVTDERLAGKSRAIIDPDGNKMPLNGVDAVDAVAGKGHIIVQKGVGHDTYTILDRGGLSKEQAKGLLNRAIAKGQLK